MTFVTFLNTTLSWLTVVGQLFVVFVLIQLLRGKTQGKCMVFIGKHGVLLGAIVALVAMIGSLSYSDIVGYEPCHLCWYQRIFMYSQVFLLGIAARKDGAHRRIVSYYGLLFSTIGALIAFAHYLLQQGIIDFSCAAVGYSVSCAKVFTMNLGYITIPLMAFTAFLMIFVSLVVYRNATAQTVK
jgi:disulfide bond formation protein DsbB